MADPVRPKKTLEQLSDKTIYKYNSALNTLQNNNVNPRVPDEVSAFVIQQKYSTSYLKTIYYALYYALKDESPQLAEFYRKIGHENADIAKEFYTNQLITANEKPKYMPYNEIQHSWQKAKDDDTLSDEWKLFYGFNVLLPPLRLDLDNLHVFSKVRPPPPNFTGNHILIYDKNKAQIVIQQHKTALFEGTLYRDIVPELMPLLLKVTKDKPIIFQVSKTRTGQKLQELLLKYTGKNATINILRHSYITSQRGTTEMSLKEQKTLAKEMGHSVLTNMAYARRA